MKRFFSILLVLCLFVTLLPVSSAAAEVIASGDWNGGNTLWKLTSDGTLTFTGTRRMQGATYPDDYPWRAYSSQVTSIVVSGQVTSIANHAFQHMTNVTSVTIGDTVEEIGAEAFRGCTSLKQITIPASVTKIGEMAFGECTALPTVTFAENSRLTTLGEGVFWASGVTSQAIPAGVRTLSGYTFSECKQLMSVTLSEGLETINSHAFYQCENLTSLRIPSTVTKIILDAFRQCTGLESLELYNCIPVANYFPESSKLTSITVLGSPEAVSGFGSCANLNSVTLPDSIKRIERDTFFSCTALDTLDWPESVEFIGNGAFAHSGFTNITLPDTVTQIEPNAFFGANLISFDCGSGLEKISNQAFQSCSSLASVNLGNVRTIGIDAFEDCSSLSTIIWSDELTSIGTRAFFNCDSLARVDIPESVTHIDSLAFQSCDSLSEINFLGDAPEMGSSCFAFVTAIAYYPAGNSTWTEEVMRDYGGDITWVPKGHVHDYVEITVAPTCTQRGYTAQKCVLCGGKCNLTNYTPPLEHDMRGATCTEPRSCQREGCGYTEGIALNHRWDDPFASVRTCVTCGITDDHVHEYTNIIFAPNCTDQGYTSHMCTICRHAYIDSYTDPLGHDMADVSCGEQNYCQREDCGYHGSIQPHPWKDPDAVIRVCEVCGATEGGYRIHLEGIEAGESPTVWIDGVEYAVTIDGRNRYVDLDHTNATNLVVYTYNDPNAADVHTQYPTGMKVWTLVCHGGNYSNVYVGDFDNLLQYSGSSIRIAGVKGIRMITSIEKAKKNALTGSGLAGYKLVEYGTLLAQTSKMGNGPLILGMDYSKSNYAYKRGVADPIFASTANTVQYTNVLVGFNMDQCKEDIAMRPYLIVEDAQGNQLTIYGGVIYRSIGYIAYQNRNVFNAGSASYNYVWEIIHHVYGDKYDADYKS